MYAISEVKTFAKDHIRLSMVTKALLCSFLIALCAMIRIPLPFTPVPITLQTFAVMLIGGALGRRYGTLSVLFYLAESLIGLPVLSGGTSNPLALFSPVGGYLIGFAVQAYLTGWFVERTLTYGKGVVFLGIFAASIVQLVLGALVLGFYVGHTHAIYMGVIPFLIGDYLKVSAATVILTKYAR